MRGLWALPLIALAAAALEVPRMSPCSRSWSVSSAGGCAGPPRRTTSRPGPSPSRSRSTSCTAAGAPGGSGPSPSSRSRPPSCSASAGSSSHGGLDTLARRSLRSVSRRRHGGAGSATHHPSRCHRRRAPHGPATERRRPPCSALEPSRPRRQIRRRHGLPRRFLTREALSRPRQASSAVAQAVPRRSHLPAARQRRRPRNRGAGRRANPPPPPRLRSIPLASGSTATSPSHPTSRPGSSTLEQLATRAVAGTTVGARGQAATAGHWTRPPSTWRPGPLRDVSGCGLPQRLPSPDGGSTKARSGRPLARRRR